MFGLGKGKQIVGLDIGSSSIKVVELKRTGKELQATKLAIEMLPPEIVVDGAIVDPGHVSNSIAKVFSEQKITGKQVATSVSGHSVIVKKLTLQPMTDEELDGAIQMEAGLRSPLVIPEGDRGHPVIGPPPG